MFITQHIEAWKNRYQIPQEIKNKYIFPNRGNSNYWSRTRDIHSKILFGLDVRWVEA